MIQLFFDKVPKFSHYKSKYLILTGIEFDHIDIYPNLEKVLEVFSSLVKKMPSDGLIVAWEEDENVRHLISQAPCRVMTYGINKGEYTISDRQVTAQGQYFRVMRRNQFLASIQISSLGMHNALNSLSAFVLAQGLSWPLDKTVKGLKNFKGVKRRGEVLSNKNGILVIEDFAHHPTAVRFSLEGLKEAYPNRRLFSVFEPRSATSRRKIFQKEYIKSFLCTDRVIVASAYDQSKIEKEDRFSSQLLVEDLKKKSVNALWIPSSDDIISFLVKEVRPGDIICIMSNGGFGGIYQELVERL